MEAFRQSRDQFAALPSLDACLQPYKDLASDIPDDVFPKLTDKQHRVARYQGFKDWQSLHYFIKSHHEELKSIDLNCDEWGYIYDSVNGWAVPIGHCRLLLHNLVDADRYEGLSGKWFDDLSKAWEDETDEHYEPSGKMRAFIRKIQDLTPKQEIAVVMKALAFWERTFDANPYSTKVRRSSPDLSSSDTHR